MAQSGHPGEAGSEGEVGGGGEVLLGRFRSDVERARDVALFRYVLIRQVADPGLTHRQRGALVRELAADEHPGPFGDVVRVSRVSIDRWTRAWRSGGFEALMPCSRRCTPATPAAVLDLAAALKREVPERTAAQIAAILGAHAGSAPSERTLQRHFVRLELNTRPDGKAPRAFGRFEAEAPGDRWTGDALHGPKIGGRKTYLFAFIDDHSRALVGYRWGHSEDTLRLEAALRAGLSARGIPKSVYCDNGSAYVSKQLLRSLASLGIRLIHSRPGQPAGRGKIERVFRTVREQFLVELGAPGALEAVGDLDRLNELFTAWVEGVYHHRVHSETGQEPLHRFLAGGPPTAATPAQLREAFLWSHQRKVTKLATISLFSNVYEVDTALIGRTVDVVFDPFDLARLEIRYQNRPMGLAVPQRIGRHVHPSAHHESPRLPIEPTGIDYLSIVAEAHRKRLATRINYTDLPAQPTTRPGPHTHVDTSTDEVDQPGDPDTSPEAEQDTTAVTELEAELASFAALRRPTDPTQLAGQMDLDQLIQDLAHYDGDTDDAEGPGRR